jgi:hypothetical protein
MEIIDNFLDQNYFNDIKNIIFSDNFPWFFIRGVNYIGDGNYQFVHMFYHENEYKPSSNLFEHLKPILNKLNAHAVIKVKANLLTKTENYIIHEFHTDIQKSKQKFAKTSILYVNTNNGFTTFKNGDKVDSIENRIVTFDSELEHSGSTCTDEDCRIVINFNYF